MHYSKQFRVAPQADVRLNEINPDFAGTFESRKAAQELIDRNALRLRELQELLYAEHKRSLLICLQAMDAGGKDGVITHVLGAMNPQGCNVRSFKKPVGRELDHDFLWRVYCQVPATGEVAIFNRSHYEDVLVPSVHKLLPKEVIKQRYRDINAVERHLTDNGTHILKFFLHIGKDEQLKRFKDRLDDPGKHWKISIDDYREREYWKEYSRAFEHMLSACSTKEAPWFVIPANHKWFRNLAVSQILVEYLEALPMKYPQPQTDIKLIRKEYERAERS